MNQRRRLNRPSVVARVPIRSSHPLFPGFHQTFICITIPPTSLAGNSSMRNANHIFSRQGFTPCFNFPRAHQGNIRPASRRAAFTEQIRPQPLCSSSNPQSLCISSSHNPCVLLPTYCLCTNPPPECPLQEMPHPDLPSSGVVLQSNRGTGMCLPVLATVTVWTSHPAPLLASFCIQTLSRVLTLTSDRLATCGSVSDNSHGSMTESWRHVPDVREQVETSVKDALMPS